MNDISHNTAVDEVTIIIPPIQERVKKTYERLQADFSKTESKIHRFPQGLRWIGGKDDRYIVPSFVALGPYHHDKPHLKKTELKHAAAHFFCMESSHPVEEVYGKILSVSGEARGCYDEDAVAAFSEAEFAEMMFLDGCFLLNYLSRNYKCDMLTNRMVLSTGPCMLRDIMLLENQIPWLVLDALMSFMPVDVHVFLAVLLSESIHIVRGRRPRSVGTDAVKSSGSGQHLLGHTRSCLIDGIVPHLEIGYSNEGEFPGLSSSAVELSEMGIRLAPSTTAWFADMDLRSKKAPPLLGELSLTPMFLNDFIACWLINMAALEACMATWTVAGEEGHPFVSDGFVISSYLSFLALLMDKEEDVHELRAKHIITSFFSDEELLAFFKGLSRHLRLGTRYFAMIQKIGAYNRDRRVFIVVHKFFYHNLKTIVTLISIATVLVGLFKAILSLKQTYPAH
ncbi:hypothetical protein E2562_032793 [Oryza meyeriana var. granulata]|uniref:Uncharacterized protein n=1 Tax=Oryza meyeriana var. granulata TaxID=110450 RepID=A0A6G1DT81_9ORYZ|nr:hypothetical protein E2562_032793 [Oryza meyeriana var. granulata]